MMTSDLLYHTFAFLILCSFIPTSSQRNLQIPLKHGEDHRLYDEAIEIPIISTGTGSSEIHLVPVRIGEPSQTLFLIPDTGSDASWFYCDRKPYYQTNRDKPGYRIFDYSLSNTFTPLTCNYTHEYVDGTSTAGFWARETLTLRSSKGLDLKFKNVRIGCSSPASTNLTDGDGILGLSPDYPSFTAHVASEYESTFSYSLSSAKAKLGQNLLVFGKHSGSSFDRNRMQYTKLAHTDSFFFVEVACLFIDDEPLEIPKNAWKYDVQNDRGGVILDTGTTFAYVPEIAFRAIREFYAEFFQTYGGGVVITESDVCYNSLACEFAGVRVPEMAIEFEGGARFVPDRENLLYEDGGGMKCLGIRPTDVSDGSIIGSNLQKGYFWEYDLLNQRVGFAPLI